MHSSQSFLADVPFNELTERSVRDSTQEYLFILWMRDVDGELKVVRAQESVDSALAKAFFSRIQ